MLYNLPSDMRFTDQDLADLVRCNDALRMHECSNPLRIILLNLQPQDRTLCAPSDPGGPQLFAEPPADLE